MSPPDLRAELARNIIAPLRKYAPVNFCDQAERDIIDLLPVSARVVAGERRGRRETSSVAPCLFDFARLDG
jgi:hypothetical protein